MYCLTVSLSQEGLKALSAPRQTMRKVLDNIGVVTGKTTGKQDKCNNPHNRFFAFDYADCANRLLLISLF